MMERHDRLGIFIDRLVQPRLILVAHLPVTVDRNHSFLVGGGVEVIVQTFGLGFRDDCVQNGHYLFRAVSVPGGGISLPKICQHKTLISVIPTFIFSDKRGGSYRHKTQNRHQGGGYQHIRLHL